MWIKNWKIFRNVTFLDYLYVILFNDPIIHSDENHVIVW